MNNFQQFLEAQTNRTTLCNVHLELNHLEEVIAFLISRNIQFSISYSEILSHKKSQEAEITHQGRTNQLLSSLEANIKECFLNGISFDIEEFAKHQKAKVSALNYAFKRAYGISIYQFYINERMKYAATLLKRGYKANYVSNVVGYGEKSAIKFNKMFQKHFGMTPKKYQMKNVSFVRKNKEMIVKD